MAQMTVKIALVSSFPKAKAEAKYVVELRKIPWSMRYRGLSFKNLLNTYLFLMPSGKIPIQDKYMCLLALILYVLLIPFFQCLRPANTSWPSPVPSSSSVVPFSASGLLPGVLLGM